MPRRRNRRAGREFSTWLNESRAPAECSGQPETCGPTKSVHSIRAAIASENGGEEPGSIESRGKPKPGKRPSPRGKLAGPQAPIGPAGHQRARHQLVQDDRGAKWAAHEINLVPNGQQWRTTGERARAHRHPAWVGRNEKILEKQRNSKSRVSSDPDGTRTRVPAVKGRCPRPLDDGASGQTSKTAGAASSKP